MISRLTVYSDNNPDQIYIDTFDALQISNGLEAISVKFYRVSTEKYNVSIDSTPNDILEAFSEEIKVISSEGGYRAVDSVIVNSLTPNKSAIRQKYLKEHTHAEDEVRLFINGHALFCLHSGDKIYHIICCKNDLISVPGNLKHWFDMGSDPNFCSIRFFQNPEGWIAEYTPDTEISFKFPLLP